MWLPRANARNATSHERNIAWIQRAPGATSHASALHAGRSSCLLIPCPPTLDHARVAAPVRTHKAEKLDLTPPWSSTWQPQLFRSNKAGRAFIGLQRNPCGVASFLVSFSRDSQLKDVVQDLERDDHQRLHVVSLPEPAVSEISSDKLTEDHVY